MLSCSSGRMTVTESHWEKLYDYAMDILGRIENPKGVPPQWSFGGGTAMMLQIKHRKSFDIDLFSDNPQQLGFVNAIVMDNYIDNEKASYRGDGHEYLKVVFEDLGQIDFVIANHFLRDYGFRTTIRGHEILMETIPEIIAKKVYHRGKYFVSRDVFDIAACHAGYKKDIIDALKEMPEELELFAKKLQETRNLLGDFETELDDLFVLPKHKIILPDVLDIVEELVDDTRNEAVLEDRVEDNPSDSKPPRPRPGI